MFDDFDLYETCEEYYGEEEWIILSNIGKASTWRCLG